MLKINGREIHVHKEKWREKYLFNTRTYSGAHLARCAVDTEALSPGLKRQGHEADHWPPSSAEVKKVGAIAPLPHMSSCTVLN
jgi:hypothetical protein